MAKSKTKKAVKGPKPSKSKKARPAKSVKDYDPKMADQAAGGPTVWHDVQAAAGEGKVLVEGRGFEAPGDIDPDHFFRRLPARAHGKVTGGVWHLCHHSSGMSVCFQTDATAIWARWKLADVGTPGAEALAMNHMTATGVSGLDLYIKDEQLGWRWVAAGRPSERTNSLQLIQGLAPGLKTFRLYLPLYNSLESVAIGLPAGAVLKPGPRYGKPVVFYGTSVTHGGCACRPGMTYIALVGRWLDCPTVNLGFSGSGHAEPEMAEMLSEIDAAVFVIDCLPNCIGREEFMRVEPLVRLLRQRRPEAAIVMMESIYFTNCRYQPQITATIDEKNEYFRNLFARLKGEGWRRLHYIPGRALLGDDGEATVDGPHPTDLGFMRMAKGVAPVIRKALR